MIAALCATVWALTAVASAQAVTEPFEFTGGEQTFEVPDGITSIEVAAIGGKGGDEGPAIQGGEPAEVTGILSVTPGQILYIEVGGNGDDPDTGAEGGFNGGGDGGAGGGGASDIRTSPRSVDLKTEDTRLIVAAGGGGAGVSGENSGGAGGDAEASGEDGEESENEGGGGATPEDPGLGGFGTDVSGEDGQLGLGGAGGSGTGPPGGGGGGGLYGGGGGGGSVVVAGGGGGGGSSLVPEGGTVEVASGEEPLVEISFTPPTPPTPEVKPPAGAPPPAAPETILGSHPKKTVKTKKKRAKVRFAFSSPTAGATFQCKIDKGAFAACKSPKTYNLKPGKHTFSVFALSGGVTDPSPATFGFKVKKTK